MRLRYNKCNDYLAYFQPATNTYAPVERLRAVYEEALSHPQVVGLVIGTRPDCVPDEVLDLIEELALREVRHPATWMRSKPVSENGSTWRSSMACRRCMTGRSIG